MPRVTAVLVPSDTNIFQAVDWKNGRCVATLFFFDHKEEYSFAFTQFKSRRKPNMAQAQALWSWYEILFLFRAAQKPF